MGASTFTVFHASTKRRSEAFSDAVADARHEYGHRGYTGSLAEKGECVFISKVKTKAEALDLADKLIDDCDERIDDKWGPAGVIEVEEPAGFLFFGWASS